MSMDVKIHQPTKKCLGSEFNTIIELLYSIGNPHGPNVKGIFRKQWKEEGLEREKRMTKKIIALGETLAKKECNWGKSAKELATEYLECLENAREGQSVWKCFETPARSKLIHVFGSGYHFQEAQQPPREKHLVAGPIPGLFHYED